MVKKVIDFVSSRLARLHRSKPATTAPAGKVARAASLPGRRLSPGLHCRCGKDGRVYYCIDFQFRGRRHYMRLGPVTREQAEARVREAWDFARRREAGLELDPAPPLRFSDVVQRYLGNMKARGCTSKSIAAAARSIRVVEPFLAGRPIDAITTADIERARDELMKERGSETVRRVVSTVATVFRFGERNGFCPRNPAAGLVPPRGRRAFRESWCLDPNEESRLHGAFQGLGLDRFWPAVILAIDTGLRTSEIVSLRREAILPSGNVLRICGGKFPWRRDRERYIPLTRRAAWLLGRSARVAEAAGSPWIFPSAEDPARHVSPAVLLRAFQEATQRCGWGRRRFHDLRHAFHLRRRVSGLHRLIEQAGAEARSFVGSASISATEAYLRRDLDTEALRPLVERLEEWLRAKGAWSSEPEAGAASAPEVRRAA